MTLSWLLCNAHNASYKIPFDDLYSKYTITYCLCSFSKWFTKAARVTRVNAGSKNETKHTKARKITWTDYLIPQPSQQTKDTCTSPSLLIAPATTKTHHQDTIRRSRFSLHCTYCLEISEQLHCR